MGPIGSPETSFSNHLRPRNDPKDGIIQFNAAEAYGLASAVKFVNVLTELTVFP